MLVPERRRAPPLLPSEAAWFDVAGSTMGRLASQEAPSMQADEIRFLFAYDLWATQRVLTVVVGLDPGVWTRTDVVGERGLGAILVHHLGASQRWRHAFQDTGESPEPERESLP